MRDQPDLPGLSLLSLRVLREDQPSQQELTVAYRRYARKPQSRSPRLLVSRWLVAGLVMGLGIAFGAEAVVQRVYAPQAATVPPPPLVVPRAAHNVVQLDALPRRERATPEPVPEPAVSASPTPHAPSSANSKPSSLGVVERPTADSAIWAKAAQGLRNNDFAQTELALATLEHAGSTADREAARLIRAQLLMHQGDASGARALLRDLADAAQSAQVRAKARSLLARTSAKSNSALNVAPSGT